MRSGQNARLGVPLVAAACLLGCGAGASFDGHVFRNEQLAFRLSAVPEAFHPIAPEGALLAFRDDDGGATVAVSGRCGKDGDDVPLEALTHHLFLEFTDRNVESQVREQLDGREALRTTLTAKLDGVEKRFVVFVLKKNGCVYDFLRVSRPGAGAEGEQRFVAFVEGFSTIAP